MNPSLIAKIIRGTLEVAVGTVAIMAFDVLWEKWTEGIDREALQAAVPVEAPECHGVVIESHQNGCGCRG